MKRPTTDGRNGSSVVTTPRTSTMMQLLGSGGSYGGVTLSRDEFQAVRKLYGYEREGPNKKPPPPVAPELPANATSYDREDARRKHETAVKAHANWTDPQPFMQAGADRNAIRHAEADGLRLLAWLAKFVAAGEDPLKTLVQFAVDAGCDVDPSDVEWAEVESEDA